MKQRNTYRSRLVKGLLLFMLTFTVVAGSIPAMPAVETQAATKKKIQRSDLRTVQGIF